MNDQPQELRKLDLLDWIANAVSFGRLVAMYVRMRRAEDQLRRVTKELDAARAQLAVIKGTFKG